MRELEPTASGLELELFSSKAPGASITPKNSESSPLELAQRRGGARASRELPQEIVRLVEDCLDEAEKWLLHDQAADYREEILESYFRLNSFQRTADLYDGRFVTIIEQLPSVKVRLFCLDPSFLLREALGRGKTAVFFSATLTPLEYYRDLLGGSPEDRWFGSQRLFRQKIWLSWWRIESGPISKPGTKRWKMWWPPSARCSRNGRGTTS